MRISLPHGRKLTINISHRAPRTRDEMLRQMATNRHRAEHELLDYLTNADYLAGAQQAFRDARKGVTGGCSGKSAELRCLRADN